MFFLNDVAMIHDALGESEVEKLFTPRDFFEFDTSQNYRKNGALPFPERARED